MQVSNKTILIADNEIDLGKILAKRFKDLEYKVFLATNGNEALTIFKKETPDLVIIDVLLPKVNGYDVCRKIRETTNVPIILLTALNSLPNRIIGLKLGAAEYLTKPFALDELEIRVSSILRRDNFQITERQEVFKFGPLHINTSKKQLIKNSEYITLTPTEFSLLEILVKNAGRELSRTVILTNIWGYIPNRLIDTRVVDVHIYRLRSKIEENPKKPDFILTTRGRGYKFQPFFF